MAGKLLSDRDIYLCYILAALKFLVYFYSAFYKLSLDSDEVFVFPVWRAGRWYLFEVKLKNFHSIAFDFGRHLIYNHWSDQFTRWGAWLICLSFW